MADPVVYSNPLSPENVIYKNNPSSEPVGTRPTSGTQVAQENYSLQAHSIRASKTITEEALRQYLTSKKSPLAENADTLLRSPYWSTIIGICAIEEYGCSVNPFGSNNLWGIMCGDTICRYPDLLAGIDAIDRFLERAEARGRTTIESFRGWYCASACTTWEPTVIKVKLLVENL